MMVVPPHAAVGVTRVAAVRRRPSPSPRRTGSGSSVASPAESGEDPEPSVHLSNRSPVSSPTAGRDSAAAAGHCRHAAPRAAHLPRAASALTAATITSAEALGREHRIEDDGIDHARP